LPQTRQIQFLVHGFQQIIENCVILLLFMIVCAQCDVVMTSGVCLHWELVSYVIDKVTKQWRTCLRPCIKTKGGHFEHRL